MFTIHNVFLVLYRLKLKLIDNTVVTVTLLLNEYSLSHIHNSNISTGKIEHSMYSHMAQGVQFNECEMLFMGVL